MAGPADDIAEGHSALAAVQAAWNAAGQRWDAIALAGIYTEDAVFFGGRPGHSVGLPAIREYFESYVGVIESAALDLIDQHIMKMAPGCYLAQGCGNFSFVLAGGQSTRSLLRTTLVIVAEGERWKIRLHHFSASPATPPLGQSG
jgi:uncharacterized protein (TIGR02246 family)